MNSAEYINAVIGFRLEENRIDPREAARLRGRLIEIINWSDNQDFDLPGMPQLTKEVRDRYDSEVDK